MFAIDYHDQGTPAPAAAGAPVTLEIDGQAISVPAGTSLMRAAALAGIAVPKLCATDTLKAFGSCRLCLVEIEGRKGYPASCTTLAEAGMKVRTQSQHLSQLRRGVIDLYVSDHPLECATCAADGHCELQSMAAQVGVTESSYAPGAVHRPLEVDRSNPYFQFDPQLCIVCSRCVRACDDIQGTFALTVQGRGFDSKIVASEARMYTGTTRPRARTIEPTARPYASRPRSKSERRGRFFSISPTCLCRNIQVETTGTNVLERKYDVIIANPTASDNGTNRAWAAPCMKNDGMKTASTQSIARSRGTAVC